ncbi:hypothetical protein Tco_1486511 [Tanacetum coccineum]
MFNSSTTLATIFTKLIDDPRYWSHAACTTPPSPLVTCRLRAMGNDGAYMKERVRCGSFFCGFMIASSSSSSSSSSYWVASNPTTKRESTGNLGWLVVESGGAEVVSSRE